MPVQKPHPDAYVSVVFAKRVTGGGSEDLVLHGVGPAFAPVAPGEMTGELIGVLYVTVYFRNPRVGSHEIVVTIREPGSELDIASFGPEISERPSPYDGFEAKTMKVYVELERGLYLFCVKVDGVVRSVLPVVVAEESTLLHE